MPATVRVPGALGGAMRGLPGLLGLLRFFVILSMMAPLAGAAPLLVGVVPDLPGDEAGGDAVAIWTPDDVDLEGYLISDGEGAWAFPTQRLAAGQTLWVVGNTTTWQRHQGAGPTVSMAGALRLGNEGDDVHLLAPDGSVLDSMTYGDKDSTGTLRRSSPGLVLQRDHVDGDWTDTDAATDWSTPRMHRIGESRLDRPTFEVDALTLYSSPDSSFATLRDLVGSATWRLHLHVYELRSAELADLLVAAKTRHPALDLQVLVDADPVGQTATERHQTADALRRVQAVGGVAVLAGNGRYDDHHLKVLVADDAVAIQSENWVDSGVPRDPSWGNRGWGVVLHDAEAADWFAAWMAADRATWDARPYDLDLHDPLFEVPPRRDPRTGDYAPVVPALLLQGPVRVTPFVSPDHTADPRADPVAALLADAHASIVAQHLDLAAAARNALGWASQDPWLTALEEAAGRGVEVDVLLAAPFAADDDGNELAVRRLQAAGAEAAILDRPGLATLHNKGFILDGHVVVVGSTNGNHHSRSANREVAVALASPAAAAFFESLAKDDSDPPEPGRDWSVPGQDVRALRSVPVPPWPTLLALMGVATITRVRR